MVDARRWLSRYGAAWENADGEAAAALFTDDAEYHWGPFVAPLVGHAAIRARWQEATAGQGELRFAGEPLGRDGDRVFSRWIVSETPVDGSPPTELDGIFVLDFAPDGRCRRLQEWWMVKPPPQA